MDTSDYQGVIIEESLESNDILSKVAIVTTTVEKVTDKHRTPWLSKWTLHTVLIPEAEARRVADEISRSLDRSHHSSWYADFKNKTHHFVVFPDKVFRINRSSKSQYDEARRHGISLGIPEYQVDFHPNAEEWEKS